MGILDEIDRVVAPLTGTGPSAAENCTAQGVVQNSPWTRAVRSAGLDPTQRVRQAKLSRSEPMVAAPPASQWKPTQVRAGAP